MLVTLLYGMAKRLSARLFLLNTGGLIDEEASHLAGKDRA
jgi:hypothetical protein